MAQKAFQVILTGDQVAPSVTTSAFEVGLVIFDDVAVTAQYLVRVQGLDFRAVLGGAPRTANPNDDVTNMHVHNNARGAGGPLSFGQILPNHDLNDFQLRENADGTVDGQGVWEANEGAMNATLATFAATLSGTALRTDAPLYFDQHTHGFGVGEIRGQWVAIADDDANGILGVQPSNLLDGLGGDDSIYGGAGPDGIRGGTGNDYVYGRGGNNVLAGDDGNDRLYADGGNDTMEGGAGDDVLDGAAGDDVLSGDAGSDILIRGTGSDTLFGGGGPVDGLFYDRLASQADGVEDVFRIFNPGAQTIGVYQSVEGFEPGVDKIDVTATGATGLANFAFGSYPGVGVKVVVVADGSAFLILGQDQASIAADWFTFA